MYGSTLFDNLGPGAALTATQPRPAAQLAPSGHQGERLENLFDVLSYVSPPLELIELLQGLEEGQGLEPAVAAWLRRWEVIRTAEPSPALDSYQGRPGEAVIIYAPGLERN